MIVDTNVLIRIMQGDKQAVQKISHLQDQHVRINVSAISVFELYHSLERISNPDERRQKIETVLDSKPTYPATDAIMKKAGRIDGRLSAAGSAIGMGDTIIAATALVHEEPVLTENVKHFERVDGLSVNTY